MSTIQRTPEYGRTPGNPVRLNSISASRKYLDCLVTVEGFHIVYHRPGSVNDDQIIDHYEIMDTSGRYDDIYISLYNEENSWIPPVGYLFEKRIEIYWFESNEDLQLQIDELETCVDSLYLYNEPDVNIEEYFLGNPWLPALEFLLDESMGDTSRIKGFPFPLLEMLADQSPFLTSEKRHEILSSVKLRPGSQTI